LACSKIHYENVVKSEVKKYLEMILNHLSEKRQYVLQLLFIC